MKGTQSRQRSPVLVRFTEREGVRWTVWDVTSSNNKHHRRPHGDPTATERVFVNAEGMRCAYEFKPSESRVFEEQALERQLKIAKSRDASAGTSQRTPRETR